MNDGVGRFDPFGHVDALVERRDLIRFVDGFQEHPPAFRHLVSNPPSAVSFEQDEKKKAGRTSKDSATQTFLPSLPHLLSSVNS